MMGIGYFCTVLSMYVHVYIYLASVAMEQYHYTTISLCVSFVAMYLYQLVV